MQDAFAPIDIAGEQAETDEIVEITLDLFPRASELKRDVDDRKLATGHEHVEEPALVTNAFARLFFGASPREEENSATDKWRHQEQKPEQEPEDSARTFKRQVRPGDTLRLEVELQQIRRGIGMGSGTATVEGELACRGDIMFALVDKPDALR